MTQKPSKQTLTRNKSLIIVNVIKLNIVKKNDELGGFITNNQTRTQNKQCNDNNIKELN